MQIRTQNNQELYPLHGFELPSIGEVTAEPFKNYIQWVNTLPSLVLPTEIPSTYRLNDV